LPVVADPYRTSKGTGMTRRRSSRRRQPCLYLRLHLGCLGCSIPLLAILAALTAVLVVV